MTADTHESASDRVAEAVAGTDAELIVMVQGDEPMTHPEMIDAAVEPFRHDPQLGCVNLVRAIDNKADFYDVNTIKVVMNQQGRRSLYVATTDTDCPVFVSTRFYACIRLQTGMHYSIPARNIARFRPTAFHSAGAAGIRRHATVAGARISSEDGENEV